MDPHIRPVEVVAREGGRIVVRTGFEAVIELRDGCPMPRFLDFGVKSYEDMEAFKALADLAMSDGGKVIFDLAGTFTDTSKMVAVLVKETES